MMPEKDANDDQRDDSLEDRLAVLRPRHMISTNDNQILANQLWIGDAIDAAHAPSLRERGITAIVSLGETPTSYLTLPGIRYRRIVLEDEHCANLLVHLNDATAFINIQLTQYMYPPGRVLVHCRAGVSRSASVCIAYLMRYRRLPLLFVREALNQRSPLGQTTKVHAHEL
jgi:hypothetical protein